MHLCRSNLFGEGPPKTKQGESVALALFSLTGHKTLAVTLWVHPNNGSEEVVTSESSYKRWHLDVFARLQRDFGPTVQGSDLVS